MLRGVFCLLVLAAGTTPTVRGAETNSANSASIRIGIAPGTWQGLNRNDATAAIGAWAKSILQQRGIAITVETKLFESGEELSGALAQGRIDCASMLTEQFLALDPKLQPAEILIAVSGDSFTERYVLLVPRDSDIRDLAGLRGRKLLVQSSLRASLTLPWLENLLAAQNLGASGDFFGNLTKTEKPSKAVLPVFFNQADACLVTSNAFAVAGELNPQLRAKLRILLVSPQVVPSLFFFRPDYVSRIRDELEPAIVSVHESPAGRELLTVFQCDRMIKCPVGCLDATRQMLSPLHNLKPEISTTQNGEPPVRILVHEKL